MKRFEILEDIMLSFLGRIGTEDYTIGPKDKMTLEANEHTIWLVIIAYILFFGPPSFVAYSVALLGLFLWCKSESKPFNTWKPSTMKSFWRNWNS